MEHCFLSKRIFQQNSVTQVLPCKHIKGMGMLQVSEYQQYQDATADEEGEYEGEEADKE